MLKLLLNDWSPLKRRSLIKAWGFWPGFNKRLVSNKRKWAFKQVKIVLMVNYDQLRFASEPWGGAEGAAAP